MLMNFWKKLPYWLKGGIIGGGVAIIFVVLFYSCAFSFSFIPTNNDYAGLICLTFATFGPAYPTAWLINLFAPVFQYNWIFAETNALILSIPLFFIVGLIVGSLVEFIKSRNKTAICIFFIIFSIITVGLCTLVIKSSTSIVSVFPLFAKVGEIINIKVSNFDHDGYSRINLIQYEKAGEGYRNIGELWVGKIPSSNVISFIINKKNCFDSSTPCDLFIETTPGKYKLRVTGPGRGDTSLRETDFTIVP